MKNLLLLGPYVGSFVVVLTEKHIFHVVRVSNLLQGKYLDGLLGVTFFRTLRICAMLKCILHNYRKKVDNLDNSATLKQCHKQHLNHILICASLEKKSCQYATQQLFEEENKILHTQLHFTG